MEKSLFDVMHVLGRCSRDQLQEKCVIGPVRESQARSVPLGAVAELTYI